MPKKKNVNSEKLIKAVKSGTPATEIMEKFGIKTSAQLKALYLDALVSKGEAPAIAGRQKSAASVSKSKSIVVNKRGSLVIPRPLVEEMGFKLDDAFNIRKTKAGISLKKA